jgi:hypothetical protein
MMMWKEARSSPMATSTYRNEAETCLGRTCMKWGADGDLNPLDLELVMQRLAQVDHEVEESQEQTSSIS